MLKSQAFRLLLIPFVAGIGIQSFLSLPLFGVWASFVFGVLFLLFGGIRKRKGLLSIGILCLGSALGMLRFAQSAYALPDLTGFQETEVTFEGVVREPPRLTEQTGQVILRVERVGNTPIPGHFLLRVVAKKYPPIHMGEVLSVTGRIEAPKEKDIPFLLKDKLAGTVVFPEAIVIGRGEVGVFRTALFSLKERFTLGIHAVLPEPHAGFLAGILLGETSALPKEIRDNFQKSGTSHIVALSGYNVTILGTVFTMVLLACFLRFFTAIRLSALLIVLFVIGTGASPSAVRAGIMAVLALAAVHEGRQYHFPTGLFFAAALMVYANPFVLRYDLGFQLSFLATVGLGVLAPGIENALFGVFRRAGTFVGIQQHYVRPEDGEGIGRRLLRIFSETTGAQLAVFPVLAGAFGQVSLISPVANLFVLCAVPYAMAFGFFAGLAGLFSDALGKIAAAPAWLLLEYMLKTTEFFASLPFASVVFPAWAWVPGGIVYAILMLRLLKLRNKKSSGTLVGVPEENIHAPEV